MTPAEELAVELGSGLGAPVRVEWEPSALARGTAESWRLAGALDGDRVAELRLLSAAFDDGSMLAVACLRPRDAGGHDEDELAAVLTRPGAEPAETSDVRLSVEYDGGGRPRRAGLELYADPDSPPLRIAADRTDADGDAAEAIAMEFRLDGTRGTGFYEIHPA